MKLWLQPWGFDPKEIDTPTLMFYSKDGFFNPNEWSDWYLDNL